MNLNQITVPVIDVERSITFYEKLGLRLIVKSLPTYARFECKEGSSTFSLHRVDNLPNGEGIWVYFEIQNLDEYVNSLMDKGLVFEELPNDKHWLWRESRLKDPDNNQIIFYFAGNNRTNPPWRIESKN
jgi:catechol 2,3-dioxygenase-like lactoylglutathione lyase family enzyme